MVLTVGFDATAAARQRAGIGRYSRELLVALSSRQEDHHFRLFHCAGGNGYLPPLGPRFRVRALPISDRITNAVWHRARLPFPVELFTGRFDLFHSPDFTAPPTLGAPRIITIHDLAFIRHPECAYPSLRAYLEKVVPRAADGAAHIVAVSSNTKRDVMEILNIPAERITVISPGVKAPFRPIADCAEARRLVVGLGVLEPYILAVSTLEPRKNYVRLLEAYALLRQRGVTHRLVIFGGLGWLYEPIFDRMRELHLQEHVTVVGGDDDSLAALYGLADAYVCASLYEGFGITPLEALACAAPVACSNASSLPEVVGEAAVVFDPLDVEGMARAIERLLTDRDLANSLRDRGPEQAARFSWQRAAEATVTMYQRVMGHA